nr:uncharacterized protein LOC107449991 isoform X4 [Parasteatoda tepidariorum]
MGLPNNCYTINSFVGEVQTKIKKIPSKTYVNIKIKTSVKDTFYTATPAVFQISIHNPRVLVNPFKKGISVKPCFNYYLYPSKVVNILMSAPYDTNCTDYFEEWVARGGVGPLSQTQCREECLLNATLEDSHCVDPFYIAYPNTAPICNQPVYGNKYFKKCLHLCSRACYREDILIDVEEHASLLARVHFCFDNSIQQNGSKNFQIFREVSGNRNVWQYWRYFGSLAWYFSYGDNRCL